MDKMEFEGEVLTANKDIFIVRIINDNGTTQDISTKLSGKIRINSVRILPGDKVKIEVSPYDTTRGRIVYRMK